MRIHGLVILCSSFCASQYYDAGFPIEGKPDSCFCADVLSKSTPLPVPFTLRWFNPQKINVPEEPEEFGPKARWGLE